MKIKVCGITRKEDLQRLIEYQVDYAGFIFYEKSPRFAASKIDARTVREITGIKKVGVFVNASQEQVLRTILDFGLDMVQLHGDETPAFCAAIREKVTVIKAFRVGEDVNWDALLAAYMPVTDYFLFDTEAGKAYGGTGKRFNWELLQTYPYTHPFYLSGGIGLEETPELLQLQLPALFAVDVNSRFEEQPGIKNMEKVRLFIDQIQSTYLK
ncbi:phosphoribosylanthranilate isomerase [Chitinophaga rhizophila]|uniref:N-(5'-phosphoribosyl)anthranilate isomerase n=1 Tax=Chitinophaga rhizophila TaxID=2866212 RepID=A0ABS7G9Z6_9BACT|nr:phosphoribosylanthranilate isomerase [Chitinophaga rhizophila]MBW8684120.1 phosphoribosylanthranilate isomerase [Chitinophaga rhizophila]